MIVSCGSAPSKSAIPGFSYAQAKVTGTWERSVIAQSASESVGFRFSMS
jgi:hypothetical protein